MEGDADGGDILVVLAIGAAIAADFAPLTVRLYRTNGPGTRPTPARSRPASA